MTLSIQILTFIFTLFAFLVFLVICARHVAWLFNPKTHDMNSVEMVSELVAGVALVLFALYVLNGVLK